ncbi:epimerase [Lysinibacillus sp. 2017]|uniref:NAD(P)-dependent oxidoreductase n=1 Tax=unclassified Lysinibacillus TaxID=2636778 RepID=UPI000D526E5C|nr:MULTISPECIES: NAD(P)-binding oxidoreductase [unclassified Lysinibacillus]AWE08476.1 epimerase [Lysinibacillus sp. 2017]TGN34964.1 NAD(P)-dependent oxidoreductase [Lysinibacillus sp. S2017]
MKIIVFGATGGVGQQFVQMAVEAGHEVTAFARTPEKLKTTGVNIIQGDAFNAEQVAAAIPGHEAVISCLGSSTGTKKSNELETMGKNIADGMEKAGVKRLVYCASAGVDREIPGIMGKMMMKMLANPLADHRAALDYYKSKGVVYTIARPMGLKDAPLTTDYKEEVDGVPKGSSTIPRASVAHFMVKALADPAYENKSVGLCS